MITSGTETIELQVWSPSVIRVEAAPGNVIPAKTSLAVIAKPQPGAWNLEDSTTTVRLLAGEISAEVDKGTGTIRFFDRAGHALLREIPAGRSFPPATQPARDGLQPTVTFARQSAERYFGAGVINDELFKPNATVDFTNGNTRIRIPVLYSSLGYGVFWDNPAKGNLHLSPDRLVWKSAAGDLVDYYVMAGPSADQVVRQYRFLTGAAPLFPKWAYGFWFSKNRFKTQQEILNAGQAFRDHRFPVDLLVQDYFYWKPDGAKSNSAGWGTHHFVPERYPDPKAMITELHQKDHIHFMTVTWAKLQEETDHAKELIAAGALFPPSGDWAGADLRYYDPYLAEGRRIYGRQVMESLLPLGVDAFWIDGAEPEMKPETFASFDAGPTPVSRVMGAFPLMHTTSLYQAQRQADPRQRVVLLPRSSWAGMQRNGAANWTGDIHSDWKTLEWQIRGLQNYSVAGLPYITTDIGGYSPTPELNAELFIRWFQWGAFCPIFRVHGIDRMFPWQYGPDVEAILLKADTLRYRLLPYIYGLAGGVTHHSGTIMRPLVMDFREDSQALETWDEFMFGPGLLVCPVHTNQHVTIGLAIAGPTPAGPAQTRNVYLPANTGWTDFWTGDAQAGGHTIVAPAPIDRIPLYVRAGTILPLGPASQYADEPSAEPVELRVYRGANGSFTLYDDAGDGYGYEKGACSTIPLAWDEAKATLTIGARQGSYPGMPGKRTFRIVWVSDGHGAGVEPTKQSDAEVQYSGKRITIKAKPAGE